MIHSRTIGCTLALALASMTSSLAAPAPAAPPAAPAAPAGAANPNDPANQYSINQNIGDWVVRCVLTTIKSPAPCDMMQVTVNKDNQQRISSFSIAYVPSRDTYAVQIVVPNGVALAKGLALAAGEKSMANARFTRCERDGCYMETLVDVATVTALSKVGTSTDIAVTTYGNNNEVKLPVSLTGFMEAHDRMKGLARDRAVALPATTPAAPAR